MNLKQFTKAVEKLQPKAIVSVPDYGRGIAVRVDAPEGYCFSSLSHFYSAISYTGGYGPLFGEILEEMREFGMAEIEICDCEDCTDYRESQ